METQVRSAEQMVKLFAEDATLLARLKSDPNPIAVLKETATKAEAISEPAYRGDKVLYRIAVSVLGSVVLVVVISSVILVFSDKTTPEGIVAMGSAAGGALVGLFAPSPTGK